MKYLSVYLFSRPVTKRAKLLLFASCYLSNLIARKNYFLPAVLRQPLCTLIILLSGSLISVSADAADIELKVENITELNGTLLWSIYDNESDYNNDAQPLLAGRSRVTAASIRLTLHDLPDGEYAVKLFHDANDNGEMDSNLLGLPQEGYGFSNNAGSFGPASYADAKVIVDSNTKILITLR